MRAREIIREGQITTTISNIEEELVDIAAEQEDIDSRSFMDDDPMLTRDYSAYEAIATILRNDAKNVQSSEGVINYFFYYIDDYLVAAIQGQLVENVLEIKWVGSIMPGKGKLLIDHVVQIAKADGATKAKLTAKWESDAYYRKHDFQELPGTKGIFTGSEFEKDIDETIQLNELKEYFDHDRKYWLNSSGELYKIKLGGEHSAWVKRTYKDHYKPGDRFKVAFNDGWIRVEPQGGDLQLQGGREAIRKAFKYWWPTAILKNLVFIEAERISPEYGYPEHFSYAMPKDKAKLRRDFGPLT